MRLLCAAAIGGVLLAGAAQPAPEHPRLLFSPADRAAIKTRADAPPLRETARRLLERARTQLTAPPLIPSLTARGAPDPPGEQKGLACARALQGRVLTAAMAFTLTGDRRFRDHAVAELRRAIDAWRIWVDTAHQPPFDLMTGEICLTFGLAWDWLYDDLTAAERDELRRGVERRGLQAYLDATGAARPANFVTAHHNWNPVCNGGAAVLALALGRESELSPRVLDVAVPAMDRYWNHLGDDGGWDEGTGYWTYGHRYAFIAAEALRRAGRSGGAERLAMPGAKATGYFPIVFNPGRTLTAGFGDSNSRVNDPILYFLGREYRNADFIWFQDRATPRPVTREGWPEEALSLVWRPVNEPWLPETQPGFTPTLPPTYVFPSIGWAFMAPSQPDPPFFLALKNGSLAANHTHLDLNHVNVGAADAALAVELGSRPYPPDYFGAKRYSYYELSTAGHNTVLVGGKGQRHGKAGRIEGPVNGPNFEALVGIADGAYEIDTPRARRHVVHVAKRFWVLLDEIDTATPQRLDIRFHTYGAVTRPSPDRWTFTQGQSALDIVSPAGQALTPFTESPSGWIRPVVALNVQTERAAAHTVVTVLYPRPAAAAGLASVTVDRDETTIVVRAAGERVTFARGTDGWRVQSVKPQALAPP